MTTAFNHIFFNIYPNVVLIVMSTILLDIRFALPSWAGFSGLDTFPADEEINGKGRSRTNTGVQER